MAVLGNLEYLISIDSSRLGKGISDSESKVKQFGNRLSAWTVAKGQAIARFAEKAISSVGRFASDSVSEAMSFDKSMSQVAATLGKSVDEIGELSRFARKMGAETAFTADQAAQALNYMALAGYDSEKSMRMLPTVLNLAAAGNMELALASDMVTDAQSALGLTIEETETMVDQMAKTSSRTNTSVAQLGEAFLTVGGTAKMLKGGTKELSAVLGVLADNGVKGSEGGTALRNILLSLSAPTDKAAKQLKQLRLSVFDKEGNMRSLPEIMEDFKTAMDGMTSEQRTSIISEIFNKRDLKSVEALLGTNKQRWAELSKEIGGANGAAKEMAETQLDNLSGDVTKFKSALGEAKLTLVEGLTPSLRDFVQGGTALIQRLTDAFKEDGFNGAVQEAGKIFNDFITNLKESDSPVLQWIGAGLETVQKVATWIEEHQDGVVAAITAIVGAFAVSKILAFVSAFNPVTLVIGSIALLAGVVADNWEAIKGTVIAIWEEIKSAVTNAYDAIKEFFADPQEALSAAWTVAAKWFEDTIWKPIADAATNAWNAVSSFFGDILSSLEAAWNGVVEFFQPIIDVFNNVKDAVSSAYEWVTKMLGLNGKSSSTTSSHTHTNTTINRVYTDENGGQVTEYADGSEDVEGGAGHSFAKGNWNVPYDNFPALLHRGERVLTASQARHQGSDVDYGVIGAMIGTAIEESMGRMNVMMSGEKVGDLTTRRVKKNINADSYARQRAMGG